MRAAREEWRGRCAAPAEPRGPGRGARTRRLRRVKGALPHCGEPRLRCAAAVFFSKAYFPMQVFKNAWMLSSTKISPVFLTCAFFLVWRCNIRNHIFCCFSYQQVPRCRDKVMKSSWSYDFGRWMPQPPPQKKPTLGSKWLRLSSFSTIRCYSKALILWGGGSKVLGEPRRGGGV